jgi:hypothetical protein
MRRRKGKHTQKEAENSSPSLQSKTKEKKQAGSSLWCRLC